MQKQTIFEIPLYVCEVENHQDQKQKLITYIDEYFEKDIQTINLENTAEVTEKNLHVSNWFDDLVKYIGSQCPQLHGDFGISLNRSLGVSGMWATRCQRGFRIDQEVFAVPEGSMLLFPSHLIPKYSTNASDDPRYIVHFLIDIVE